MTKIKMTTEPVPRTSTATETADVTIISTPSEVRGVANFSYPEGVNRSVGRYGKGQSILVNSFEKKLKLRKRKSKLAWKVKAAHKVVKNLLKKARRKVGVY